MEVRTGRIALHSALFIAATAGLLAWQGIQPAADPITFEDIAARAGVQFVLRNGATPQRHQIETMVSGVAVLDYNNDGRPDLYFVNGAPQPGLEKTSLEWYNRLYRNDGNGRFTDVTDAAGVRGAGFATGVAAADYDNDGYTDLFVAGVHRNTLYHNRGDGTFEDVTAKAGLTQPRDRPWSISAGWFDYDNDGLLDLFVVNYVVWNPATEPFCGDLQRNLRSYCHPKYYEGLPNTLYHNNGDGTFTDVSRESGIAAHVGKGMSVNFADYDGDGRIDVFVTNDTVPNFLFHNEGRGRFREMALEAGVAYSQDGRALSNMGSDFRDVDNDGRPDIFIGALMNETHPLYLNLGGGMFHDVTNARGIAKTAFIYSGWSNGIFDFNNDGWKDLFVACGDVNDNAELFSSRKSRQRNLVFANRGGQFVESGASAGPGLQQAGLHRGAAFADFDGDGRVDVVVSKIGEPAELLHNTSATRNHWLALRLRGTKSNRDAIGARIHLTGASGREQWNHVTTSVGYGCSSDRTVYFGLGKGTAARRIEISWPSGIMQVLENIQGDRILDVVEPWINSEVM